MHVILTTSLLLHWYWNEVLDKKALGRRRTLWRLIGGSNILADCIWYRTVFNLLF